MRGSLAVLVATTLLGPGPQDQAGSTSDASVSEGEARERARSETEQANLEPAPPQRRERRRRRAQRDGREGPEAPPALGDLSARGTDNGALELGLGATSIVVTGALIAHGIYQIFEARRKAEICLGATTDPPECNFDGPNLRYAGAGLSFGFAVPVAVGAGLFLRKGLRINRDYKAYRKQNPATTLRFDGLSAWARARPGVGRSGGLRLALSF